MNDWRRVEFEQVPIYIRSAAPDWFVPNSTADRFLIHYRETGNPDDTLKHLLPRLSGTEPTTYESRDGLLALGELKECWLHLTNRCNMTCRHCMFGCNPHAMEEMSVQQCIRVIQEAYALGCRIFYFTGGEPMLARTFLDSLQQILNLSETHVVVLTNLTLIERHREALSSFPQDRLHYQVSLDGMEANHDALRGPGAFAAVRENLSVLRDCGFPATLSMSVTQANVGEMQDLVRFAREQSIDHVHFLWLFRKGKADDSLFVTSDRIFEQLQQAQLCAETLGVSIDNVEILRSQVFSCPGTRYDLSNAGWQSLAVGPKGGVYPTPALIGTDDMRCGTVDNGLETVWRTSETLKQIRAASLNQSEACLDNPFRYLVGGGDIDHSYIHAGTIVGDDPYVELYNMLAQWLIVREAGRCAENSMPAFRLRMGEVFGECPVDGGAVFFTHSNCVLSLPGHDSRDRVNRFYSKAAVEVEEDILNPVCYEEELIAHIPEEMRVRSYGCGSPVLEAEIGPGEVVLDLGSGTGIECFIAAKLVGENGRAIGIDMGDTMLDIAQRTQKHVAKALGYGNVAFQKAFLEELPMKDSSVDVVISNCVVNLSPDKRRVFQEIRRVLKPGGRLVISDITYDGFIPLDIAYSEKLRGECIGGALRYNDLFGLLNDLEFSESCILKGYQYRTVKDHDFYSVTYRARKLLAGQSVQGYDFPDFNEVMEAVACEPSCACFEAPEQPAKPAAGKPMAHKSGCMVCGARLVYLETDDNRACHYCGNLRSANAECESGHFVCDGCHRADAVSVAKQVCLHNREPDVIALLDRVRAHPQFRVHGPEHHSLLPAVILASLRNSGYPVSDKQIETAIQRGQTVAGGACAFLGACGAAVGVGIAISILTGANPLNGDKRQVAQRATQRVLGEIAAFNAPRCCQRDCCMALHEASKLTAEHVGQALTMPETITCTQHAKNNECIHDKCPYWPG